MNTTEWLYVKLFHGPSQERAEYLLLHLVRPLTDALLAEKMIDGYFYILYFEGGAHIRLRLRGEGTRLQCEVRPRLERMIPPLFETIQQMPLQAGQSWPSSEPLRPFPSYEYATYEPEYAKYGGPHCIGLSERHFQHSSDAALAIIAAEHAGELKRHQAALRLIEVLVSEAASHVPDRAAFYGYCRDYWLMATCATIEERQEWLRYFERRAQAARQVVAHQLTRPPQAPLASLEGAFRRQVVQTYGALQNEEMAGRLETPIPFIVQNYIHMLCNRLGISILEEAYLLHLLSCWSSESEVVLR